MQRKENKHNKWSLEMKLSLLSITITFLGILSQWTPFLTKKLTILSELIGIPTLALQLIIGLVLLVILSLILLLICIFSKKNKFKPSKKMIEFLKLMRNNKRIYSSNIPKLLSISRDETKMLTHFLPANNFIEEYIPSAPSIQEKNRIRLPAGNGWNLSAKGIAYLSKKRLL